ncbi:MAG TPA: type II secretion system F family protein [Gemmatimonadaceae bacterium]|nr:type II secretion system F family protein [Gemmatimonadaceae bacterium]
MTRRLLLFVLVGLAALAPAYAAYGAAGDHARVTEAADSSFPGRSYVLTLPSGIKLKTGAVRVFENGELVSGLAVTPVSESTSKQFGVVLAIDSSTSMEGKPEEAAFAAARAFAAQRRGQEQLAALTYNLSPTVVLPFTTDQSKIDEALSKQPAFLFGTHIYDAVARSLELLRARNIKAGTVIVLSDGQEHRSVGDTSKHETEESVAAAARAGHVRVFAVGLSSRLSKLVALQKLARDTGGRYLETTSISRLKKIYTELGSSLASEYLLHYRSTLGPNKHVRVTVHVDGLSGGALATEYRTPQLTISRKGPTPPYKPSTMTRLWRSPLTMSIVGLIVAGLIGLGASMILSGPKKGTVRRRMAEFVSVPTAIRDSSRRPTAQITDKMLEGTDSALRSSTWWQRFRWESEIAKVTIPPEQIIMLTGIGSLLSLFVIKFLFGSLLIGIGIAMAIPIGVRSILKRKLARQRKLFAEQLPDNLQVLASALRAGHSFIGALSVVVNDAPEPARSEFQRVVADEQLGVPIDEALHVVVQRMDSRELEQVALVGALQRETGGNTAEVLDQVTDTIRERFELKRTVQTLTAQGRMSRWVLTLLPIFLLIAITLINPGYMHVMYASMAGKALLVISAISVAGGSLVIKRIVNIRV